jgi:DNA-binding GntR family transcriptional regulator
MIGRERKAASKPKATSPHQRQKAHAAEEFVHDQIVQAVMEHRLPPGTKLDEDLLARLFGISRTRFRKVISILVNEAIVTHRLNHGAFISLPSTKEAKDIFVARRGIEDMIVRLAGARRPAIDFARLRAFVGHEAQAYARQARDTNHVSGDFHVILADLVGNDVLSAFARQLVVRTNLVQAIYGPPHICLVHQHEEIIEALEAGQGEQAAALMSGHLAAIEDACDLRELTNEPVDLTAVFKDVCSSARGRLIKAR